MHIGCPSTRVGRTDQWYCGRLIPISHSITILVCVEADAMLTSDFRLRKRLLVMRTQRFSRTR